MKKELDTDITGEEGAESGVSDHAKSPRKGRCVTITDLPSPQSKLQRKVRDLSVPDPNKRQSQPGVESQLELMIPAPTSINQPSCGPLSLVLDHELELPSDASLGLTHVHSPVDRKDPDPPPEFPGDDNDGTINEGNDQSRDSFSDDIGDLFDDAILSLRKQPVLSGSDENPNSETTDKLKLDSFVSTDRNTPEALLEQPTHSSPNPTATRRRSPRLNRE